MASPLSPDQFTLHTIKASEIRKGDRIGASLKTTIHTVLPRGEQMLYASKTRGARSGTTHTAHKDAEIKVWRKT